MKKLLPLAILALSCAVAQAWEIQQWKDPETGVVSFGSVPIKPPAVHVRGDSRVLWTDHSGPEQMHDRTARQVNVQPSKDSVTCDAACINRVKQLESEGESERLRLLVDRRSIQHRESNERRLQSPMATH
jgi:hypothetical protein